MGLARRSTNPVLPLRTWRIPHTRSWRMSIFLGWVREKRQKVLFRARSRVTREKRRHVGKKDREMKRERERKKEREKEQNIERKRNEKFMKVEMRWIKIEKEREVWWKKWRQKPVDGGTETSNRTITSAKGRKTTMRRGKKLLEARQRGRARSCVVARERQTGERSYECEGDGNKRKTEQG